MKQAGIIWNSLEITMQSLDVFVIFCNGYKQFSILLRVKVQSHLPLPCEILQSKSSHFNRNLGNQESEKKNSNTDFALNSRESQFATFTMFVNRSLN